MPKFTVMVPVEVEYRKSELKDADVPKRIRSAFQDQGKYPRVSSSAGWSYTSRFDRVLEKSIRDAMGKTSAQENTK